MPDPITKVLTGGLCAGCGGCAAVAPDAAEMRHTADGFLRPHFSQMMSPDQLETLSHICPSVSQMCDSGGRQNDPTWGPYISASKGRACDPGLRHIAASGGALSGFLASLLTSGAVEGVIHVSADSGDPLANVTQVSTTPADVMRAAGSRYAPSSPLDVLQSLRGDARRFAFVGKPCDVSALFALRNHDPDIARLVPILVSFFCAGIPSLMGGRAVVERMGIAPSDVAQFQHRAEGWPGHATAQLRDGSRRRMSYADSWGNILSKTVQHRCKLCADGVGMFADVVFADAWEADANGYPSFEDRPGQSLVLTRTAKGQELVAAAQGSGHIALSHYDLGSLAAVQPGQTRRRRALLARLAALWLMRRPIPNYRGMGVLGMARQASTLEFLRNFFGTLRRAILQKEKQSC